MRSPNHPYPPKGVLHSDVSRNLRLLQTLSSHTRLVCLYYFSLQSTRVRLTPTWSHVGVSFPSLTGRLPGCCPLGSFVRSLVVPTIVLTVHSPERISKFITFDVPLLIVPNDYVSLYSFLEKGDYLYLYCPTPPLGGPCRSCFDTFCTVLFSLYRTHFFSYRTITPCISF